MRIIKNNQEIEIHENITNVSLDEDDHIKITEYVRFFDPKLDYGSLVLVDNEKELRIDNITNVLNTSDAKVEFIDCLIDSMDELFELIKYSLGSEFHIDIQDMVNEDSGDFELAIFDVIEDTKNQNETKEKTFTTDDLFESKQSLLILVSTPNPDTILNFPMIYTNLAIQKDSWASINLIFFGSTINSITENSKLKNKISHLISKDVNINYFDDFNEFYEKTEIEELGIKPTYDHEFVTKAIKSKEWSVITI